MISYADALTIIEHEATCRGARCRIERLALPDCINRCSAADVLARDQNPRFDNSAMDGFALRAADSRGASADRPVRLPVLGCLAAGEEFQLSGSDERRCIEIMTGSKIPAGCVDTVVPLEDVSVEGDSAGNIQAIAMRSPVTPGENIRRGGEDIRIGERLFGRGTRILPQHLMALSMAGYTELEVFSRPKVIVISTGNEIVSFDTPELLPQQIRNSTAPLLCSVLEMYGVAVQYYGIVRDERDELRRMLLEVCELRPEIIITTGGVSVGRFDLVAAVLRECGARIHFHKVAIRPGKPILFGDFGPGDFSAGGPVVFGLPGNPMAVAAAARFFIRPYLRALLGQEREPAQLLPLVGETRKPAGLSFFQRGVRDGQGVRVLPGQASFMVASLLKADGWIVGAAEPGLLRQGETVEWYPLW